MRRLLAVLWTALLFAPSPAFAQSRAFVMTAQEIALHADRGLLVAQGGVAVRGEKIEITATLAVYDLRSNRLTAQGNVTVKDASGTKQGDGYVYQFALAGGAFVSGAVVPDLNTQDALAIGQQIDLAPAASIVFSNAQVRSGASFVPAASYAYTIPPPSAKNFGSSPVPSAALEWPLLVSSGRDGYTFARLRYDKYNGGPGTGLEEHFAASNRGYVAFAQTVDADAARFDLSAYEQMNDALSQSLLASSLPGWRSVRYAIASSSRHGFAQLSFAQDNAQRSDDFLLSGNERPVWGIGSSRLQIDAGHDVHPSDANVAEDWRMTPSVHFDTATVHIGHASVSGSADAGESLYNYGRASLATAAGIWSTVPVDSHLQFNGGVNFTHQAPPFPQTFRTYSAGMTWNASQAFRLVSSLTYTHDFDQSFGNGRPQYSAAFDLRVRRKNGAGIEIGTILPFGGVGNMNHQAVLNVRFIR